MIRKAAGCSAVLLLILLLIPASIYAQTEVWTLAASEFSIDTDVQELTSEDQKTAGALAKDIPMLILSSISGSLERSVSSSELTARELYELQSRMPSLLSDYGTALKTRDQQVFIEQNKRDLNTKIEEYEKKIAESAKKIKDNFDAQSKLLSSFTSSPPGREKVVIYKNSSESLFSYDKEKIKTDADFNALMKNDTIRGLITGSIKILSGYIQVTSSIRLFPQNIITEPVTILCSITEPEYAASRIASSHMESISNSLPSIVNFKLYPEDQTGQASVFLSDLYLKGSSSQASVLRGIYSIRIECPGFKTVSFAYSFNQNTEYTVSVTMEKQLFYPVTVNNPFSTPGTMFMNAVSYGSFPASITVNDRPYLGEFVSEQGWSNYFTYNGNLAQEFKEFNLSYANKDIASRIEKSRNRLYISYASVIFALPVYFYTDAVYKNLIAAQENLIPVTGTPASWKTASTISLSAVAVLAVNMGVQLALYLRDADKILPMEQSPEKDKGK